MIYISKNIAGLARRTVMGSNLHSRHGQMALPYVTRCVGGLVMDTDKTVHIVMLAQALIDVLRRLVGCLGFKTIQNSSTFSLSVK